MALEGMEVHLKIFFVYKKIQYIYVERQILKIRLSFLINFYSNVTLGLKKPFFSFSLLSLIIKVEQVRLQYHFLIEMMTLQAKQVA